MAIIVKGIQHAKHYCSKSFLRRNMAKWKRDARREYRRTSKHAIKSGRDINEKPRLTSWHII